ncbi:TetR/AcrR family transcriptional regulator [Ferrimonas balearica]|uniref:TetR/AcrR family transcriptional regulator n=1 Tax=Ferrimonas balearica TaxID=44012 RepID=UPI001F22917B|nr:TetR/AcrR family transcriptional regulator [Ferrimonas balearica]MBY6096779.1 TetR/AcrR family transcriptional regulator [Ferrimonas balearica]
MFNKAQIRKVKIAKAAMKLIREQGYLQFSMNELTKEVGVTAGTLYRTFASKDDLLVYLFSSTIETLADSMYKFSRMDLSAKEKIVCCHCYQFYFRQFYPDSTSLDLIGTNKVIFNQARPETREKFKRIFDLSAMKFKSQFSELVDSGKVKADEELLYQVMRQLTIIGRGGMVISNHVFIPRDAFKIEDLISLCCHTLDQLDWQGDEGKADIRLILLALRSEVEQSVSELW